MREFEEFAILLAEQSGKIIRQYFRTPVSVESKADASPVTIADRKAEEVMRELVMKQFPEHGIRGEEFGSHNPDAEYTWVLDPIDGTKNFICGGLAFGTLIGLLKRHQPLLGVIDQPILGERLVGNNQTTTLNGRRVQVRKCTELSTAIMLTSDAYLFDGHQNKEGFERLRKRVKLCRGWGDCYGYFLLALGCVDIMVDPIMHFWDIAALVPVVRGAGGVITDMQGNVPMQGDSLVATGGEIHDQVVKILNNW